MFSYHTNQGLRSSAGHETCVERLVQAGADVSATDHGNATALWNAAWKGSQACVKALIKAGASVNKPSDSGISLLAIAAEMGHVDCMKTLIEAGAIVNQPASLYYGYTPLMFAAEIVTLIALRRCYKQEPM